MLKKKDARTPGRTAQGNKLKVHSIQHIYTEPLGMGWIWKPDILDHVRAYREGRNERSWSLLPPAAIDGCVYVKSVTTRRESAIPPKEEGTTTALGVVPSIFSRFAPS